MIKRENTIQMTVGGLTLDLDAQGFSERRHLL